MLQVVLDSFSSDSVDEDDYEPSVGISEEDEDESDEDVEDEVSSQGNLLAYLCELTLLFLSSFVSLVFPCLHVCFAGGKKKRHARQGGPSGSQPAKKKRSRIGEPCGTSK